MLLHGALTFAFDKDSILVSTVNDGIRVDARLHRRGSMMRRSGALPGGFQVDVKPHGPKDADDKAPDVNQRVTELFNRLGGEGRLTIERFHDDGKREYCGRIPATAEIGECLEDEIGRRFGGGRYYVTGYLKGVYVGSAEVNLSRDIRPVGTDVKKEDLRREEPRQQSFDMVQWLAMTEAREEKARQAAQQQAAMQAQQQAAMMQVLMQTQANQTQQMMGVFTVLASALGGRQTEVAPQPNGMAQLMEAVNAIQQVKQMTGVESPLAPETTMTERVLGMAVGPIAAKVGDMIADQMKPKPAPAAAAPHPPAAATVQALAASNPGAGGMQTPRHVPPPPAPMPPTDHRNKLPPGVTPLTAEQLRTRAAGRRPAGPSAPSVSDVESTRK